MNHLFAKTKGRNGDFFKVMSDVKVFELPDELSNQIKYTTDYKLEEDEWFAIENFSEQEYCIEFLTRRFVSIDYGQVLEEDYNNIDYLCSYQDDVYYFQKVSPSHVIRKKYFSFSDEPTLVENKPIIVIDNTPNAIYKKDNDTLYFKNLSSITSIFKGIEELYREATQQETETFLNNDFILLNNNYSAGKVKKANRKRIALAMETLQRFTPEQKHDIFNYIRGYCKELTFDEDNKNFAISNEDELKKLLYGIEQRYYTTLMGGERRLANSIISIS